jgi:asparagine synthase (glutamine-hydrolysing)
MCGIAGFIAPADITTDRRQILQRMTGEIRHRGPDDEGFYLDELAALGHRRLSIIDLSGGHQPMSNEDGTRWIVYNGEIFNHAALRPELESAGHRFQSRCDTEMIVHAWEQYGDDCVSRFRGMFAFALWDRESRTLFCARDRLGIKPLYYYWDGRLFIFASEIKAILRHPVISARFDDSLLAEHLAFGYISDDRTLFSGIRKLMPGHTLRLDFGGPVPELITQQYWDVPEPGPAETRDDNSWIRECRSRLEETVRMRLMSDVPLGMFLSGGVDSSTIAALMKRMVSGPVQTFAVGYDESEYSELSYARHVAGRLGTDHHEVVIGMDEFFGALPQLIWHEDEPIAWPSSVSLHFVSQLAAKHVKVVLTGEGSDELFAGYARYRFFALNQRWLPAYRLLPAPLRRWVRDRIGSDPRLPASLRRKLQHTVIGAGETLEDLYLDNFYSALSWSDQRKLSRRAHDPAAAYGSFLRYWEAASGRSLFGRMLFADQKTYLVELLMKQDQMSMASSLESRVPFLDHILVEFAARVPDSLKIRNGTGKYILKKAVEDLLPADIIYRRKMGFPTPLRQWLREDKASSIFAALRDPKGLLAAYLDVGRLEELLAQQSRGSHDATDRIWRLLNLQVWGDLFITGRSSRWQEGILGTPHAAVR